MEYEEFGRKVKQAFEDSKRRYGAVKLCRVLNGAGTPCSIKRVQRHMAEQGLRSVVVKKYSHHANHGSIPDDKVNILKRDFGTETINQKWCTDITYIHVQKEGWTYLASVMDLCSRKIIGYAYGTSMTAELAVKAVENACLNVRDTKGIILHSDLGSQYTSKTFEDCLMFIEKSWKDKKNLHLAAADQEDNYLGTVSLKNIRGGSAEFAIVICPDAMGTGLSAEAMKEMIRLGFEDMNLKWIYWCVSKKNQKALRFYDKNQYRRVPESEAAAYAGEGQRQGLIWYCERKL